MKKRFWAPQLGIVALTLCSSIYSEGLKGQFHLTSGESQYRMYVKFKQNMRTEVENGVPRFYSASRSSLDAVNQKISGLRFSPLVTLTPEEKAAVRSGRSAQAVSGFDKSAFSGLLELQGASLMPKESLIALAENLEGLDEVEYCEITPITPPPPPSVGTVPPADSWVDKQFYLYGDQGGGVSGISADYAWEKGITGQNVQIADIEWGWDYLHEEFSGSKKIVDALTTTNHTYDDHGTAVLGQMMAADNGTGVKGAVHGADRFLGFSEITKGRPEAILMALDSLKKGDILVYELQTGGQNNQYVPADYSQSVWDVTKTAVNAGIIVVAAAGNGGQNLDDTFYSAYMARGDNGSIIVGAGTKTGRNRCSFSTYGSRIDVLGIGDGTVYSTGYGDLFNGGPHATYTQRFSGTSSSTPIAASAAAAVQSYAKTKMGKTVSPKDMRALLKATGTAGGTGWGSNVPKLPNIKAAIEKLIADSGGTVVNTYALTVTGGTGAGSFEAGKSVTITATVPSGKLFDKWTSTPKGIIADSTKASAALTMPGSAASVTAVFKDPSAQTYALTVNGGTGAGSFEAGKSVAITATVPSGKLFDKWTSTPKGIIADSTKATAALTMPGSAASVTAVFKDADPVLDTSGLSVNLVKFGSWSCDVDTVGSTVSLDTAALAENRVSSSSKTAAGDEAKEIYPWTSVTASFDTSFDKSTLFKITYSSDNPVRMVLVQGTLGDDGVGFGFELPAGTKTLYLKKEQFTQPEWTADSLKAVLDLTKVSEISFESVKTNASTAVEITELKASNYTAKEKVAVLNPAKVNTAPVVLNGTALTVSREIQNGVVRVVGFNGRLVKEFAISSGQTVDFENMTLSAGAYLLQVTARDFSSPAMRMIIGRHR